MHELSHTSTFVTHITYAPGYVSAENCYGATNASTLHTAEHLPRAVKLPRVAPQVLRRCRENPYHAFCDCLWLLVHYMAV